MSTLYGSAGAQKHKVGRKRARFSYAELKADIDAGFRYFQNRRPALVKMGRPPQKEGGAK